MIYTCTLNPAVDYKLDVKDLKIGKLNRSNQANFGAGGKGINVSTILTNLKVPNIAIGFVGGFTGSFIEQSLKNKKIKFRFIHTHEATRLNIKLRNITNKNETEINQEGPIISNHEFSKLLNDINKLTAKDVLICGGRSARGIESGYVKIAKICNQRKIPFIMDISSNEMLAILKYRPFLIKPNIHELGDYYKTEIKDVKQAIKYGKKLLSEGAQNLIVSMGSNGSILLTKDKIYQAEPIKGEIISTVGAGDSMVAGFVASYFKDYDYLKAYKIAVAAATSTAFSLGLADPSGIKKYLSKVTIKEVK